MSLDICPISTTDSKNYCPSNKILLSYKRGQCAVVCLCALMDVVRCSLNRWREQSTQCIIT